MTRWLRFLPGAESRGVLANASWLYVDQVVRAVVVLATFSVVARGLGPEQFGVLSYVIAFPGVFLPLAMLGLDYVVVRDFVRHPDERDRILRTTFTLKTAAAIAAAGLAAVIAWLGPFSSSTRALLLVATGSLLFQPLLTLDFYFQSQVASKYSAIARTSACLIANALRGWFAWREAPVAWFVWAFVGEALIYAVTLWLTWKSCRLGAATLGFEWDGAIARRLLSAAWPLFLADIAIAGYLRADQLLLTKLAGPETLGKYAAAFRLADAAEFFSLALINSYFPRIVALHQSDAAAFRADLERFLGRMTWFAIAVAFGLSVASPLVTRMVLGPRFGEVWPVLAVLTWANVFVTQIAVRGKWFLVDGLQLYSLAAFALGTVVHLSLLTVIAARWGALGAAVSFCTAQATIALIAPGLFRRTRPAVVWGLRGFRPFGG